MQKYSVKLVLQHHKQNANGLCPIYIRVTVNQKVNYISTGHFTHPRLWDAKKQLCKDELINADIQHRKNEVFRSIVSKFIKSESITSHQVKGQFSANLHNFFSFVESFINEVQHKRKPGTIENYRKHALRLELYNGSKNLSFEQIDRNYLTKYEDYLKKEVGDNYINALFKTIRTFFNAARKAGIITDYPFSNYEVVKYIPPQKDYLTFKELDKVENLCDTTKNNTIKQCCTYLLLACYTGIRVSDWYKFSTKNIENGILRLRAKKNNEWVVMPVTGRLKNHLKRMSLPLTIEEPVINRTLKQIAKLLNINKLLTTHSGRHTFAITMCAEMGIPCETCAELMGITVSTCVENYYRVTKKKIMDETLRAWGHASVVLVFIFTQFSLLKIFR